MSDAKYLPPYIPYTKGLVRPKGKDQIIRVFGTIKECAMGLNLDYVHLDRPIKLAWDDSVFITKFKAHKKLVPIFEEIFNKELGRYDEDEYNKMVKDFGGCFNIRYMKGRKKYSTHSWGIAIDLNVRDNPFGSKISKQDKRLVEIFKKYGFIWGGDWEKRPDPMHFQFAEGY